MLKMINERLRILRLEKGLKLREVADLTGLSIGFISNLESGRQTPSYDALLKLNGCYGSSLDWLVYGTKSETSLTAEEKAILSECRTDKEFFLLLTDAIKSKKKLFNWFHRSHVSDISSISI